jgi:hypothetical protein
LHRRIGIRGVALGWFNGLIDRVYFRRREQGQRVHGVLAASLFRPARNWTACRLTGSFSVSSTERSQHTSKPRRRLCGVTRRRGQPLP